MDLNLLFGKLRVCDVLAVRIEVALDCLDARFPQLLP